ncbi:MAG: hypothetical protein WCF57_09890 [Pyrinomonadaceae bacterium]
MNRLKSAKLKRPLGFSILLLLLVSGCGNESQPSKEEAETAISSTRIFRNPARLYIMVGDFPGELESERKNDPTLIRLEATGLVSATEHKTDEKPYYRITLTRKAESMSEEWSDEPLPSKNTRWEATILRRELIGVKSITKVRPDTVKVELEWRQIPTKTGEEFQISDAPQHATIELKRSVGAWEADEGSIQPPIGNNVLKPAS